MPGVDLRFWKPLLYPAELRGRVQGDSKKVSFVRTFRGSPDPHQKTVHKPTLSVRDFVHVSLCCVYLT